MNPHSQALQRLRSTGWCPACWPSLCKPAPACLSFSTPDTILYVTQSPSGCSLGGIRRRCAFLSGRWLGKGAASARPYFKLVQGSCVGCFAFVLGRSLGSYGQRGDRSPRCRFRSWVGAAAHLLSLRRACLRHTPHRTVRNRFPLHRSPSLFTMEDTTVQARFLWPWEIFSLFKDLTSPRRSSAGREQLPPFPRPAFTGFIGTTAAPPGIDLLLHPQLGWSARPVRADRSIPFPRSRSSRLHPDVGTD